MCVRHSALDEMNDQRGNVCPARYLHIKYPISSPKCILTWGSPPSRLDRKHSLQCTLHKPKCENSTTHNVTPTTSNHRCCHCDKRGAKDGPYSEAWREGSPHGFVRGQKQARVGNGQKRMPGALILPQRCNCSPTASRNAPEFLQHVVARKKCGKNT